MASSNLATPIQQDNSTEKFNQFWIALGVKFPARPNGERSNTPAAIHTHDGAGRKLATPLTTDQASRAGIALFE